MIVKSRTGKKIAAALCTLILLAAFAGCTQSGEGTVGSEDILSQITTPEGKIPVTVLVKYAFSINGFEKAVEEKFPEIDIIQVGNYTSDRGIVEYERRMEHDDLTDIVMTWPLNVGEEYWDDRLMDLSGMPFTGKYSNSMLDTIAKDGKLYYLPGPAQVRGIVYNKTLFEEKGWKVPENYDEFISLCQTIEASGMRSIQLGFQNTEVLDTAFIGYCYGSCFSKPSDAQWIEDYNNGNGSLGDQFEIGLDAFQRMVDLGIWKKEDLNIDYSKRENMLFTRKCAMIEDSVLMARMGYSMNGCTDEFALMPFFDAGNQEAWTRLYMVCYIGLNKHLAEPENSEKYKLVQEVMEYISTEEGQEALMADTGAMYSSLSGMAMESVPEITALLPTLERGNYAIFPESRNVQDALRKGLAGMVAGTMTKADMVKYVDEQNRNPIRSNRENQIGVASADFTLIETGNFITDTMREKTGAEIALFLDNGKDGRYNGKGVSARIYQGTQTENDVIRILPDFKNGDPGSLETVVMNGKDLLWTLEYSIPVENDKRGWFYYFSGLKMTYAPEEEPGKRIKAITLADGSEVDPDREYTIAVMKGTVPENFIRSPKDMDITMKELLMEAFTGTEEISPSGDGRFTVESSR